MTTGRQRDDDPASEEPLRWPRDSEAEDFEAQRAGEIDKLGAWAWEQRRGRLIRALEEHGLIYDHREGWGSWIVPPGWADVPPPEAACPWCQRPAEDVAICAGCADIQRGNPDEPAMIGHWKALAPLARRLHLTMAHQIDPWTGQPAEVAHEEATIDEEGCLQVSRARAHSVVPRTSWDQRARG